MSNGVDITNNYLRLIATICTLLTIVCGVICYLISTKVQTALTPIETRVAAAEEKLATHIVASDKCLAGITNKDIFDFTVKAIYKDIKIITESQEKLAISNTKLNDKIDNLIKILIENKR